MFVAAVPSIDRVFHTETTGTQESISIPQSVTSGDVFLPKEVTESTPVVAPTGIGEDNPTEMPTSQENVTTVTTDGTSVTCQTKLATHS